MADIKEKINLLPNSPGVYIFKNKDNSIIYVGKAINLKNRVKSYFIKSLNLGEKTKKLIENISNLEIIKVDSEIEALLLEANLIQKHQPKYNIELKDNKSYPWIKISINEKYPRISQTRSVENDRALYFGPYTDVGTLKYILRELRKMFLFRSCRILPKKPCLYYFIGKCQAPCIFTSVAQEKEYKKNIKYIILFLQGKKDLLIKTFNKQMKDLVNKENFEKAESLKKLIEKIKNLTKPTTKPFEYLKNPNLMEDQIKESLQGLSKILSIKRLQRIECYDVATLQGQNSTGSMVVFTNGAKNTSEYRKFKIHVEGKPNDYQMLEEVIKRRILHLEWPSPDLIVVDGGKGQLNTFNKLGLNIPCLALAKKEEEIYYKDGKIKLERSSASLRILQRIRDEAHRFATSYHKKLRLKSLTISS